MARLEELQSYEKVYAPFDGVITARNTDVGELINAGAGTPGAELFHMAATDTLRIYVAVPEAYAPAIHIGATPTVTLDEYPGQDFDGTLVRTDDADQPGVAHVAGRGGCRQCRRQAAARAPTHSFISRCRDARAV